MSLKGILNTDWSDYDQKKREDGGDPGEFGCSVPWEVDYLVHKIGDEYPETPHLAIRRSIAICSIMVDGPHPRARFIGYVLVQLGVEENISMYSIEGNG